MQINSPETAPKYDAGELREGSLDSRVLLQGKEGTLDNYRLSFETAGQSWATPRHRHNFDQVRLAISGEVDYGKETMRAGWVAYFPETVPYGPQVRGEGSVTLGLQFGGPSCNGFMSPNERRAGFDALSAKGTIAKGVFTYFDASGQKHNQDAFEAVWEHVRGRKLVYPKPRFGNLVNMDPDAFDWVPDERAAGVSHKRLGQFTERNLTLGFVKLEEDASFTPRQYPATQILFVTRGTVSYDGQNYGLHTAFGLDPMEKSSAFRGAGDAEMMFIQLPIFTPEQHALYERTPAEAATSS